MKQRADYIEVKYKNDEYKVYIKEREKDYDGEKPKTIWDKSEYSGQTATHELKKTFNEKVFSYPKSPYLIADVLKISTNPGDLVLDFFAGSGTTGAVAHKMGRQYILCEQMDYLEGVTLKRLQKVIEGEQGGISEEVEWQGGGSFVYGEVMEFNAAFVSEIEDANSKEALQTIWQRMQENAFLSYKVDPKTVNEEKETFDVFSLNEQKQFLVEVLDKNQLYVNYSEIEDEDYGISEDGQKQNHQFYKLK
jgi:adenine-specific DNA-methyltransferase